jgi:hypothetical protein
MNENPNGMIVTAWSKEDYYSDAIGPIVNKAVELLTKLN